MLKQSYACTANGQHVSIGAKVKTGMQLNAEIGIVAFIDNENQALFVFRPLDNTGGWYSINTCIAI